MIRVTILGRGACSFLVKNQKKIEWWKALCNRSNPKTYRSSCPTYKEVKAKKILKQNPTS